jgi:septum formation protein
MAFLQEFDFVLASGSPRRKELFERLNLNFTIRKPEVKEYFPPHFTATEAVVFLAALKNNAVAIEKDSEIIVSSDTVVTINNRILEKPKDVDEALSMLKILSGNKHFVHTSVCLRSKTKQHSFFDTTEVTFRALTEAEMLYYIENYKPFDKAGSYGAQDWLGLIGIERLKGCFYNVMGFPVSKFYNEFNKIQW